MLIKDGRSSSTWPCLAFLIGITVEKPYQALTARRTQLLAFPKQPIGNFWLLHNQASSIQDLRVRAITVAIFLYLQFLSRKLSPLLLFSQSVHQLWYLFYCNGKYRGHRAFQPVPRRWEAGEFRGFVVWKDSRLTTKQYGFVCVVTGAQQPVGQAIVKELACELTFNPICIPISVH